MSSCVREVDLRAGEVDERADAKSGLVESRTSTVLVARFGLIWGGRWESNPQRPEPESGALPVQLLPPHLVIITRRAASAVRAGSFWIADSKNGECRSQN